MRVLITGSRDFNDRFLMHKELEAVKLYADSLGVSVTLIHGGARGADKLAGDVARELGFEVEVHPADWDRFGKAAGFIRNQEMLQSGVDACIAFPVGASRGTRHMISLVKRADVPIKVVEKK